MKDTFYFSHDCNARNDSKLQKLQMRHGMAGIGIYWCVVEMLYEDKGKISINECERIAFELRTQCELVKSVINDFNLFVVNDDFFYSKSVLNRLNERQNKTEKAKKSAAARWAKSTDSEDVASSQECERNANALKNDANAMLIKKSKVKKRKDNILSIISQDECEKEPIISFPKIKAELLASDEWRLNACQQSGQGVEFNLLIPDLIDEFFSHIVAIGEQSTILTLSDAKRRFIYWHRYNKKPLKTEKNGANRQNITVRKVTF